MQWCWAHLNRDFQALADSEDGVVKRLGHDLLRPTRELFWQWSRCRDGTISRTELNGCLMPVRRAVEGLLLRGLFSGHPRLVGMCRELYEHRQWLWPFLEQEVEPTNNAAERALRAVAIGRNVLVKRVVLTGVYVHRSSGRHGGIGLLLRLSDGIAAILLAADLLVVCGSVLLRFLSNAPVEWSDDVARGLMVGSAFFGAASALARGLEERR